MHQDLQTPSQVWSCPGWIVRSGFRVTTFRCPRRGHGGLRESVIPTQALILLISVPV
ncbi:hypothetical protein Lalb_Chr06g0175091 [Lupinus albus]|uniref:Uncharacterized protein n=1 Tax=Lupinus albus TaxID=3870 RepID=A0A6A4QGK3_LUPAL|nr:hypothetical protein Lalb_Chr06g0175091 [Lupinus albus]